MNKNEAMIAYDEMMLSFERRDWKGAMKILIALSDSEHVEVDTSLVKLQGYFCGLKLAIKEGRSK